MWSVCCDDHAMSPQELVTLLHKALEAAQQEKRASSRYLAAAEDKDRLELVRHKVRQIVELSNRVEALETDKKELEQSLALRDNRVEELQKHVQLLMDKNYAKQQVILKLTEQVVLDLSEPAQEADAVAADTLHKQQEEIEHLKVREAGTAKSAAGGLCSVWYSRRLGLVCAAPLLSRVQAVCWGWADISPVL